MEKTQTTLRGKINQCPSCGLYFSTVSVFDKHRIGAFGNGPKGTSPERRCMNASEMLFAGLQVDERGVWRGKSIGGWLEKRLSGKNTVAT